MHKLDPKFYEEEPKELIVSRNTKKLWAVLLDLLLEFDEVCKRRGIKYFLDSGTLLGAVRHKGFIPWDDDVDVIMTRSEYNKLCACASEEFKHPYFFQTNATDPGSMRGHAQFRNSLTTGILKGETSNGVPLYSFNQGIFLDVFIVDKIPNDDAEYERFATELGRAKSLPFQIREWKKYGRLLLRHHVCYGTIRFGIKGLFYLIKDKILHRDSMREAYDRFEQLAQKYDSDPHAKRCSTISFQPLRPVEKRFNVSMFSDQVMVDFAGYKFPAPKDWDEYLKCLYGNWRKHVIGGSVHGGMIIDTEKPYTEYLKK